MYFEDLKIGDILESPEKKEVTEEEVLRFMMLFKGYRKALEIYRRAANADLPFRHPNVPGMYTSTFRASEVLEFATAEEFLPFHSEQSSKWPKKVAFGDKLYVKMKVVTKQGKGRSWGYVTFQADCYKVGLDDPVCPGKEIFIVRKRIKG